MRACIDRTVVTLLPAKGRERREFDAEALARYDKPDNVKTDRGSQFASFEFTNTFKGAEVAIPMDGRSRCMDNVFIKKLWQSFKYEAVHLHELIDGFHAEWVIGDWVTFYNFERPHSALGGQTPVEACDGAMPMDMMDKAHALSTSPHAQQQYENLINRSLAA